jgi:hypothetical protein
MNPLLVDALGTQHSPVQDLNTVRIVCLVPSITELLCDLGLAAQLVGRTAYCIHPTEVVRTITKVGGTKNINIKKIHALAPTHLVVNIDENPLPEVEKLRVFIPHLIVTHPQKVMDNFALYRLLGAVFGKNNEAEKLCAQLHVALENQVDPAVSPTTSLAALPTVLPAVLTQHTALYLIWRAPWMTISADTYLADMLRLAGLHVPDYVGLNLAPAPLKRYPEITLSEKNLHSVDCVLLSTEPCNFTVSDVAELQALTTKPVRLVDGELLSWYGSRAIAGVAYARNLRREIFGEA